MPAAAVIPAPIAYIKVVAVKKLVVGSVSSRRRTTESRRGRPTRLTVHGQVIVPGVSAGRPAGRRTRAYVSGCVCPTRVAESRVRASDIKCALVRGSGSSRSRRA